MPCKFGTDGVRGIAGKELTPEFARRLGWAVVCYLTKSGQPLTAVIGRDTRASGPELVEAMALGLREGGVAVTDMGVVPTGAISFATRMGTHGVGVVVSASHNPPEYNGIKLFASSGKKLSPTSENWICEQFESLAEPPVGENPMGELWTGSEEVERYIGFLTDIAPNGLKGLRIALDAANGAASDIAPKVFESLGAEVVAIGTRPNGTNINVDCGATAPHVIQKLTQKQNAHFGVAFDGDADRAVFADADGRLLNGDQTIALWCARATSDGAPRNKTVIGTVMANSGFVEHMKNQGFHFERVPVGDRNVSDAIDNQNALIGGEPSGHVIFPHRGPTGDGLVTVLEIANLVATTGRPLRDLFVEYPIWPQVLLNFKCSNLEGWEKNSALNEALAECKVTLRSNGRIEMRASGTEPILRVMVEARTNELLAGSEAAMTATLERELAATLVQRVDLTDALGN
jgi:phosphoglucosamine mutase